MDTMDTMYKLTKQIDALTYNSRAVLNALVRSCIAAGSSNGYTVRRYGKELTLTRADIFRLYDFYQCWANGSYGYEPFTNKQEEFDDIVARCDAKWTGGDQLVTKSIVTHSKILYLVSTNKDEEGTDFWLDLIRNSSSPKLVTNSAPIPLNLRTPLYDADLSTKSFSQYETYLFPSGYNKLAITGMPGDGEEHVGGGKSWVWDIDESIEVTAPRIVLGYHSNPVQRLENYGETKYSMSFGYETYALGERSVALGGLLNIAYGTDSATVGGVRALAIGPQSMVASGYINTTVGEDTLAANYAVHAIGPYSSALNRETVSGDYTYPFIIEGDNSTPKVVDCEVIKDPVTGNCIINDGGESVLEGGGRDTVRISNVYVTENGFDHINIAAGDDVVIYAQTRKVETGSVVPTAVDGYAYKPLYFKVVKVTRQNDDYLVQLDGSIPKGESLNSMLVSGGYISRVGLTLGELNYSGTPLTPKEWHPGEASTALNYNTFTAGVNQTVVGQMNRGERDAKFVVGTGSSYVGTDSFRRNGLVVAPGYGYMQTASRSASIGVSDYAGIPYRDYDAMFVASGAWLMHSGEGTYTGYSWVNDTRVESGLYRNGVDVESSHLTFVRSGSSYLSQTHDVTACLESNAGTVIINATSYVGSDSNYDSLLQQGPIGTDVGDKGVAIYSEHGMDIRNLDESYDMSFYNSGYIAATFKGLLLTGNTWGALTTTDDARSFWVYHNAQNDYTHVFGANGHCVDYPNVIAQSGFFFGVNEGNAGATPVANRLNLPEKRTGSWDANQGRAFHIINSAVAYVNTDGVPGYDVACLALPGLTVADKDAANPPHPKVINSFISGTGNGGVMPSDTYVTEELAYLSDLDKSCLNKTFRIKMNTVSGTFFRALGDGSGAYNRPTSTDEGTFVMGNVELPIDNDMAGYFGSYTTRNAHPFSVVPILTGLVYAMPVLRAPEYSLTDITIKRIGSVVACSMEIAFPAVDILPQVKYTEVLLVLNSSPLEALGISDSFVLSGSGHQGVSVTCTMAKLNNNPLGILGSYYNPNNMLQFLIKNPNQVKGTKMSITLTGVYNEDAD